MVVVGLGYCAQATYELYVGARAHHCQPPWLTTIAIKKVTVISVPIFSTFTIFVGFANGPEMFTVCRVIAGLGLGGVMPNVVAKRSTIHIHHDR